jgi:hypothetical protein
MDRMRAKTEHETLTELNNVYIDSIVRADADQFTRILADDFLCSNPDGTILDRTEFLRRIRASTPLRDMQLEDVRIRMIGETAIIHARTVFALGDGTKGTGRYTDIWAKRDGQWHAVAAHVTRIAT